MDKKTEEPGKEVTIGFAVRFLWRYLMQGRWMELADANRIMRKADDGRRLAQALDWLMLRLSVSYILIRPFQSLEEIEAAAENAANNWRDFGVSLEEAGRQLTDYFHRGLVTDWAQTTDWAAEEETGFKPFILLNYETEDGMGEEE